MFQSRQRAAMVSSESGPREGRATSAASPSAALAVVLAAPISGKNTTSARKIAALL